METSRKNKRTYCTPKQKADFISCADQPNTPCERDDHSGVTQKSNFGNVSTNKHIQNILSQTKAKLINYKLQNAKASQDVPERIARERNRDHMVFSRANERIFQTKVTYFPGKNLNDIRQALSNNKIGDRTEKGASDINSPKGRLFNREKSFGKHLICPKKKSKKMKKVHKPLNTIEELNESERSKESLKKMDPIKSYSDVCEKTQLAVVNNEGMKDYRPAKSEVGFGQRDFVSYSFYDETSSDEQKRKQYQMPVTKYTAPVFKDQIKARHVLQIRDMFEQLSKNQVIPRKSQLDQPTMGLNPMHFEHTISCGECRKILKELMDSESVTRRDMHLAVSEMPFTSASQIVDSIVQEIYKNPVEKSDVNFKIETQNTVSKFSYRRCRRVRRKEIPKDLQYKNFFLLAVAISMVLYCFYCRLNEKQP